MLRLVILVLVQVGGMATALGESPDAISPKAAVKSFYAAVNRGDAAAVRQLLFIQDDPQQQLVAAYADLILAGKRLGDTAKQKYPGVTDAFAQGTLAPEDALEIDAATVTIEADTATLKLKDRDEPLKLRRTAGGWRVVVSDEPDASPAHRAEQLLLLQSLTEAMSQSAEEIAADKYPTAQDAENAVKDRLSAVQAKLMQSTPPTSRPATQKLEDGGRR